MFSRNFVRGANIAQKMVSLRTSLSRKYGRSRQARGGGGHDHHHDHHHPAKPLEPYEVPHHAAYPNEAHLFGIDPVRGYKWEGWELIVGVTYIAMFGMFLWDHVRVNDDDPRVWARIEAKARMKAKENGEEIQFGVFLSEKPQFQAAEELDKPPQVAN